MPETIPADLAEHPGSAMAEGAPGEASGRPRLKRALGQRDLTLFILAAVSNLNTIPVIAAGGAVTMWLWLLAIVLFLWPEGLAVIELSSRYPHEGGIYLWTKTLFGEFHGYLCGWCYVIDNVFYIPTLVLYLIGLAGYVGGPAVQAVVHDRLWACLIAIGILGLMTWLNVVGLGVGKWVNNLGAIGTMLATLLLVGLATVVVRAHGATLHPADFRVGAIDGPLVNLFSLVCFSLIGLELASTMGDEIRDPRRTLPRAVLWGGALAALLTVSATLAVLLAMPRQDISAVQGIAQAIAVMAKDVGVSWIVLPAVLLIMLAIAGTTSAWLGGSARIPFVAGVDRYLPAAFGKLHPRYATPYAALIVQTGVACVVIAMSFLGSTLEQAFKVMLLIAVVLQLIPYIYMFGGLVRLAAATPFARARYRRAVLGLAGVVGALTTMFGIVVAFLPPGGEPAWQFEAKMWVGTLFFLGLGVFLFAFYSRRAAAALAT